MSQIIRKIIFTPTASKPVGPYSQAIVADRTVYVSGVLGLDKDTMKLVEGGPTEEFKKALENLGHILEAAGSSFDKVVKSTILLNDINDFGEINKLYEAAFIKDFPARVTYQVGKLPLGAKVEMEVIALTGEVSTVCPEYPLL